MSQGPDGMTGYVPDYYRESLEEELRSLRDKLTLAKISLTSIRDATHKNAVTLRGMASDCLDRIR